MYTCTCRAAVKLQVSYRVMYMSSCYLRSRYLFMVALSGTSQTRSASLVL